MEQRATREKQYAPMLDEPAERLGLSSGYAWDDDPKHLLFTLSRYKFAAKQLAGRQRVLEIGCGDAFATRIVRQAVPQVTAIDFDPRFIEDAQQRQGVRWNIDLRVHDILETRLYDPWGWEAAFSLDVIEHIGPEHEHRFMYNIVSSLAPHGALLIGTPSLESQPYASQLSREGHVNCKSMPALLNLVGQYFHNVFPFSMNDEVVHTGYHKMAQYLFALGVEQVGDFV